MIILTCQQKGYVFVHEQQNQETVDVWKEPVSHSKSLKWCPVAFT